MSPRPGMIDPSFMTELRPRANTHAGPRSLGTPKAKDTPKRIRSSDEYQEYLSRISRPTMATHYPYECPQLSFSYVNRVETFDKKYIWNKLPMMETAIGACGAGMELLRRGPN